MDLTRTIVSLDSHACLTNKREPKIDSCSIFLHVCVCQEWGHPISLFQNQTWTWLQCVSNVTLCFSSMYYWFKNGRIYCKWTLNKNLTNVRIYDCMDLSLCQVHCCKYGEQIKKRPCCHFIVHFYIVFSTNRKIVHKMLLRFFL